MRFKYLHLLLQPGHLQDLPLRGRCGNAPHRPLLLRRLSALRTPVMPAAVDQVLGYQDLRAVQVQFHHALKDQTVQQVGEAGHVGDGAAQDSLFGHLHVVAITCVVWSLYVLIERTTEEVQEGSLEWPFWTKLIVVAIGFTGGLVFMYVQCKMYVQLCKRWRAFNRVIYVQNAPEKGFCLECDDPEPHLTKPQHSSQKDHQSHAPESETHVQH